MSPKSLLLHMPAIHLGFRSGHSSSQPVGSWDVSRTRQVPSAVGLLLRGSDYRVPGLGRTRRRASSARDFVTSQ